MASLFGSKAITGSACLGVASMVTLRAAQKGLLILAAEKFIFEPYIKPLLDEQLEKCGNNLKEGLSGFAADLEKKTNSKKQPEANPIVTPET